MNNNGKKAFILIGSFIFFALVKLFIPTLVFILAGEAKTGEFGVVMSFFAYAAFLVGGIGVMINWGTERVFVYRKTVYVATVALYVIAFITILRCIF